MNKRLTVSKANNCLSAHDEEFIEMFEHGSLLIEYYKPEKIDKQEPHERDEIYVIVSGSGWFLKEEKKHPVEVGEVLFVPAGIDHRFVDFTDDFSTWVFFYGPKGGEV